ncbi:hypothetical protein [Paraburkholderia caribensis]|uniref:hypothetical protein n=1 Tax=Paraburkholderia caribensis TaxID=75105 RepID=UPI001CC737BD|nr:hypothetical protein [Paraburkholderia caribensis]
MQHTSERPSVLIFLDALRIAYGQANQHPYEAVCYARVRQRQTGLNLLASQARECQFGFLRRPAANTMRLHIDLVHLHALLSAVVVCPFQA